MKLRMMSLAGLFATVAFVMCVPRQASPQAAGGQKTDLVISSMAGRDLFEFYCASCHGRDGKGGGHVAPALKVPPPDLTTMAQRNRGTFPALKVEALIKGNERLSSPAHGSSEMPVWGPIFRGLDDREGINAARIESIVKHIQSIQVKAKAASAQGRP